MNITDKVLLKIDADKLKENKINIDKVLIKFNAIDADKLKENKINIDENLVVENSAAKYLQLFAEFLNNMLEGGYYVSESIMNKLMNIIKYEGYEYQIMNQYYDIIMDAVYPYMKCTKDLFKNPDLDPEQSKEFINKYIETIKKGRTPIPYNQDPTRSRIFIAVELKEVEYPIDFLYRSIKDFNDKVANKINIDKIELYQEAMYIIYQNNLPAYKSLLSKDKLLLGLVLLLEEDTDKARETLLEYIDSIHSLLFLVDKLSKVNDIAKKNIKFVLEDIINKLPKDLIVDQIMNIF